MVELREVALEIREWSRNANPAGYGGLPSSLKDSLEAALLPQPTAGQVALTRDEIVNLIVAKLTEIGNRDGEVEEADPEVLAIFGEVADTLLARLARLTETEP